LKAFSKADKILFVGYQMIIEYWVINMIGVAGAVFLIVKFTMLTREVSTFAHLFSFFWGGSIVSAHFILSGALLPEINTLIILYLAWWSFLLGAVLTIMKSRYKRIAIKKYALNATRARIALIILLLLQCITIILELNANELGFSDYVKGLTNYFAVFRTTGEFEKLDLPWYLQIWRWGFVYYIPLSMILYKQKKMTLSSLCFVIILGFITAPTRFTRAPIIQISIILFICWVLLFRPKIYRQIFSAAIIFCSTFAIFVVMQIKIASISSLQRAFRIDEHLAAYFGASMKAYELIIAGRYPRLNGVYSLDILNFPLKKIGIIDSYPELTRAYMYRPITTNVYTYLDSFTLDLGIFGALFGSFVLGASIAFIYKRARYTQGYAAIAIYAYAAYGCVMAPINNEFIRFGLPLICAVTMILEKIVGINYSITKIGYNKFWLSTKL
jgi:oligosaccharide repeat unit polymerase